VLRVTEDADTPDSDAVATIYEWGGGREAFERWLNRFYDLVESEAPDVAALFGGTVSAEHRVHVTDWWVEVMGGPATYSADRGGYEHMLAQHRGLGITPEQRLAFVTLLSRAADDVGLPGDPEFRAALLGYAEWGSRLAMHNSQPGADVVEQAPVPRWGWGVAPPYQP
jgi:hemoglobin